MANENNVKIKVQVDGAKGASELGGITQRLKGLAQAAGSLPGVGGAILALGSAAGVLAGLFAGAARSLQEFAETEVGVARLEAALANVGQSTVKMRQNLKELSEQMQEATGIADDQWLASITKLIQAGADPRSVGLDLEAVKNLTAFVGDLGTATTLYARALQGNFEMFRRYGIVVKEAGDATERLKDLQEQAAVRGAGVLEAATQTLSGQLKRLKNAGFDAAEAFGQKMVNEGGVLLQWIWGATEVLADFADRTTEAYKGLGLLNRQTEDGAAAMARYKEQASAVMKLTQDSVKAIDTEVAALRAKQKVLDELADKEAALKKAEVDVLVATGKISPNEGTRRRTAIDIAAARQRGRSERGMLSAEERAQQDKVRILEERKEVVDRDLAREQKALVPERKLAKIQALAQSALNDKDAFLAAANSDWFWTPGEAVRNAAWRDETVAGIEQFRSHIEARVTNRAAERQARVNELQGMSTSLGAELTRERDRLGGVRTQTRAGTIGSQLDEATAVMRGQAALAGASRSEAESRFSDIQRGAAGTTSNLAGAANGVAQALHETTAFNAQVTASLNQFRRELAQMQTQVKNSANR